MTFPGSNVAILVSFMTTGGYIGTEFFTMIYDSTGLPTVLYICAGVSLIGALCTVLLIDLPYSGKTPFHPLNGLDGTRWAVLPQSLDDHVADGASLLVDEREETSSNSSLRGSNGFMPQSDTGLV